MTPAIAFENVSKRFVLRRERRRGLHERIAGLLRPGARGEEFWALRDVSFAVERGQSLGLVGHNGAGKSTALKLMTRILEPTSGSVQLDGRVAALLELGSGFHPDLSGRENVFLYGSLMGFGRREMLARLDEIVDFADMADFIDMEVKHYSSGMYTRLAFAVATAVDPDILITDEVLAVGDEAFQRKCMDRIYRFRHAGRTIVFVSHALETVRSLCDTAVWLDHGVARAVGSAGAVIDAYLEDVNRQELEEMVEERGAGADAGVVALHRRGTHEVEIVAVQLLDAHGREQSAFRPLEPLTIRMHYLAHMPIARPVFGIAIHHESGLWLSGPNTRFDEFEIPSTGGAGFVDYTIPALPLLNGHYLLSVTIYDEAILHLYDYHDRMYRLVVQGGGVRERYGIVPLRGQWAWQPEALDVSSSSAAPEPASTPGSYGGIP